MDRFFNYHGGKGRGRSGKEVGERINVRRSGPHAVSLTRCPHLELIAVVLFLRPKKVVSPASDRRSPRGTPETAVPGSRADHVSAFAVNVHRRIEGRSRHVTKALVFLHLSFKLPDVDLETGRCRQLHGDDRRATRESRLYTTFSATPLYLLFVHSLSCDTGRLLKWIERGLEKEISMNMEREMSNRIRKEEGERE